MIRSKLWNKHNKNNASENWIYFNKKKERNKCVEILMNVNKEYYSILYVKDVTDNRTILSRVKNHFSVIRAKQ